MKKTTKIVLTTNIMFLLSFSAIAAENNNKKLPCQVLIQQGGTAEINASVVILNLM